MVKREISIKRIYDPPLNSDGFRLLVDRLWPRGIKKVEAAIDLWLKEIAPSNELRKWFNHDPKKWPDFQQRYIQELKAKPKLTALILEKASKQPVTLLYSAKDAQYNNAQVLQTFLKTCSEFGNL
jgi:uncharacterized protein YeaO (DUF488 family)